MGESGREVLEQYCGTGQVSRHQRFAKLGGAEHVPRHDLSFSRIEAPSSKSMRNEQLSAWSQLLSGVPAEKINGPRTAIGMLNLRGINVPIDDGSSGGRSGVMSPHLPADIEVPMAK